MSTIKKYIIALLGLLILLLMVFGIDAILKVYRANIDLKGKKEAFLLIRTGWEFPQVVAELRRQGWIQNEASFQWTAEKVNYPEKVKPGRYQLTEGMNNFKLVRLLASGRQTPVKLTFNKFRTIETFVSAVCKKIEADSNELKQYLTDDVYLRPYGLNAKNALSLFIPNTYEFYWNTSAASFIKKMEEAHKKFWTAERREAAKRLGLDATQVMVLASIVEEESENKQERPIIAGVYLNRLKLPMPLQADPTVRFAWQDFTIKRVTGKHIAIQSEFNTYKREGLPPGPICIPSISSIEAVLYPSTHRYLYFCASDKLNGTHNFAETYAMHQLNARKYQAELDRRGIN